MFIKRVQLGLVHVALTMTLIPINSALNRVMIKELALSATLVAVLASLPYLFSPIQMAIGSFADRNPILGWRRSPYILLGLVLCTAGVIASPYVAYTLADNRLLGIILGAVAFGLWGMGFNFASVSYFSLATELSGPKGRSRTIAVMFFMMILSIIGTASSLGRMLEPYSPAVLQSSFLIVGLFAFALGLLGLVKLEPRHLESEHKEARFTWREMYAGMRANHQVLLFFRYLVLLLIAILSHDVLLEPFSAEVFGLSVSQSTRITSIWGSFFLVSLVMGGALEARINKLAQAKIGGWVGAVAFLLIVSSGLIGSLPTFYLGVSVLGFATGLATVSNLSLMLDMTTADRVGLFVGVWGMANAASRLVGNLLAGGLRDLISQVSGSAVAGYQVVFLIEMLLLLTSLYLLRSIDVRAFHKQAEEQFSYAERAALAGDA